MKAARRLILAGCFFFFMIPAQSQQVIVVRDYHPLPNDCAIVASEAAGRLRRAGVYARVLQIIFFDHNTVSRHAIVVWRIPGSDAIAAYDMYLMNGTEELKTTKFEAPSLAAALMLNQHILILYAKIW